MTIQMFNLTNVDSSWRACLQKGLSQMDPAYIQKLSETTDWLPGPQALFRAFSLPLEEVNYVLFGESPYPRAASANGYAFWDADVKELWSETGLSKKVNRATSLRNIIKMLLRAEGLLLNEDCSQEAISGIDKSSLVRTNTELFQNLLSHGFLLLNATLVLQKDRPPQKDARAWLPFLKVVLDHLLQTKPTVKFILWGRIANALDQLIAHLPVEKIYAEHPYNHTFIHNPTVLAFFKPLHLLRIQQLAPVSKIKSGYG